MYSLKITLIDFRFTEPEDAPDIPQFKLVNMFISVTDTGQSLIKHDITTGVHSSALLGAFAFLSMGMLSNGYSTLPVKHVLIKRPAIKI